MTRIFNAHEGDNLHHVRVLFREYASSLGLSLDFQDFTTELDVLPGEYSPPSGCLLLAKWDGQVAGCVAVRKLDDELCEMKRLFVRPQYQGLKIGRALAEAIVTEARKRGYKRMRLDTLPTMQQARSLYGSMGFAEIPPYRYNPIEGATFLELTVTQ